ncbi:MAG: hypothetical protein HLX50_13610 [Alteromonadaceae bacterium]|nr:hypothetical protein [Alteromonadaceae bacterium]
MAFRFTVLCVLVLLLSSCAFSGLNNSGEEFFVIKTENDFITGSNNAVDSGSEYLNSIKSHKLLDKVKMSEDLFVSVAVTPTILNLCEKEYLKGNLEKALIANEGSGRYLRNKIHLNLTIAENVNYEITEQIDFEDGFYNANFYTYSPIYDCSDRIAMVNSFIKSFYGVMHEVYHVDDLIDIPVGADVNLVDFEYSALKRSYCDLIMQSKFSYIDITNHVQYFKQNEYRDEAKRGYKKFFLELARVAGNTKITKETFGFPDVINWCNQL